MKTWVVMDGEWYLAGKEDTFSSNLIGAKLYTEAEAKEVCERTGFKAIDAIEGLQAMRQKAEERLSAALAEMASVQRKIGESRS